MVNLLWNFYFKMMSLPVFAESNTSDIAEKVTKMITDIISKVKQVATPIAVLCVTFCGIKLLIASDPQSVKTAKSWLITIVVALMVLYSATPLINTVVAIFGA